MRVIEANAEQRRNGRAGKTGDFREKKTRRPAALSGTRENSGVTQLGIQPGSPWWKASSLTAKKPRPISSSWLCSDKPGTTVAKRLACSTPNKVRFEFISRPGNSLIFASGNLRGTPSPCKSSCDADDLPELAASRPRWWVEDSGVGFAGRADEGGITFAGSEIRLPRDFSGCFMASYILPSELGVYTSTLPRARISTIMRRGGERGAVKGKRGCSASVKVEASNAVHHQTAQPAEIVWLDRSRDRCGAAARTSTSHQGEPGSIPSGATPGVSHVGIVPGGTTGRRVFLGFSRLLRSCILTAPCPPRFTLIGLQALVMSRQKFFTLLYLPLATVAERLDCSPPNEASSLTASFSSQVTPGFLHVGIVPDDAAGWRVFSGISIAQKEYSKPQRLHFPETGSENHLEKRSTTPRPLKFKSDILPSAKNKKLFTGIIRWCGNSDIHAGDNSMMYGVVQVSCEFSKHISCHTYVQNLTKIVTDRKFLVDVGDASAYLTDHVACVVVTALVRCRAPPNRHGLSLNKARQNLVYVTDGLRLSLPQ
ncbi:hypothetical protein PR048_017859 [Dryococelus australis]|uniref:Uncharacterized protein n=1 Tax=Dryococelus australis TaxID=614101 RepID=A0ABQ9HB96_9NEOP|nr:hypothetical protein PR048_017859 [Dryococelus australis]